MAVELPKPIAAYLAAENGGNPDALAQCFAPNATVRDEGRSRTGRAAIKAWTVETHRKYDHTVEPVAVKKKGGKVDVTVRLTGNFPGSPIEVQFLFGLKAGKITSLEIG